MTEKIREYLLGELQKWTWETTIPSISSLGKVSLTSLKTHSSRSLWHDVLVAVAKMTAPQVCIVCGHYSYALDGRKEATFRYCAESSTEQRVNSQKFHLPSQNADHGNRWWLIHLCFDMRLRPHEILVTFGFTGWTIDLRISTTPHLRAFNNDRPIPSS